MADYRVAAVDIAAARPSTVVLLDGRRAEEWFAATSVGEATEWLLARKPDVIAIDAPCSTSHGLLSKGKDGAKPYAGRVCDLELMKRGMPLYQVPQDRRASEREDLLQALLVAAPQGSKPMLGVIRASVQFPHC
jgi:predicted nuclease with RNAse H fold